MLTFPSKAYLGWRPAGKKVLRYTKPALTGLERDGSLRLWCMNTRVPALCLFSLTC